LNLQKFSRLSLFASSFFTLAALLVQGNLACAANAEDSHAANPFKVIRSQEQFPIAGGFRTDRHFAGADAAYSIELSPTKSLWLFGDTFVETSGQASADRKKCLMVRNSIALDNPQKSNSQPRFYLKRPAFFTPSSGNFYWPGDGILRGEKLYLFMHETENAPKKPPPYQFNPLTDHLLVVQNPQAEPQTWRVNDIRLGNRASQIQIGIACVQDGEYLYIYCANSACGFGLNKNPTALARIRLTDLESCAVAKAQSPIEKMQWYSNGWQEKREFLSTLFEDGASEMTVTRVTGLKGFFAFYLPFGNKALMMRHADRPEGPWSLPEVACALPAASRDMIYYSAKAHPEYKLASGEVLLTYCSNSSLLSKLMSDKNLYFPQAVRVKLVRR
jgi:hypothetical protein